MTEEVAYQVKIDLFEGPFDLLLQAIDDGKLDVNHVSLTQIVVSYFDYWRVENPDLVLAADFLYMAAYLIELKSRGLLPAKDEMLVDDNINQIEESLIDHLQEFAIFKKAAQQLRERKEIFEKIYVRHEGEKVKGEIELVDVNLRDLVLAFQRVYKEAAQREKIVPIVAEQITLEDRIDEIKQIIGLKEAGVFFEDLFIRKTRLEVVVTFLAILELAKQRYLRITQDYRFGSIVIIAVIEESSTSITIIDEGEAISGNSQA